MVYAVVITFTTNPRPIVIRKEWIFDYSEAKTLNNGINRNQIYSVYYSSNLESVADFTMEKKGFFVRDEDGVYDAKLYRFFGK